MKNCCIQSPVEVVECEVGQCGGSLGERCVNSDGMGVQEMSIFQLVTCQLVNGVVDRMDPGVVIDHDHDDMDPHRVDAYCDKNNLVKKSLQTYDFYFLDVNFQQVYYGNFDNLRQEGNKVIEEGLQSIRTEQTDCTLKGCESNKCNTDDVTLVNKLSFKKFKALNQVFQSEAIHPCCVYYPKALSNTLGFQHIGTINSAICPYMTTAPVNADIGYFDVV